MQQSRGPREDLLGESHGTLEPVVALQRVAQAAQVQDLVALAVARGCRHYETLSGGRKAPDSLRGLSHEVLACALMSGPMPQGLGCFRCGVMVLSDLSIRMDGLAAAAAIFGASSTNARVRLTA